MTKYTNRNDNHYNSFISSCVQELKKDGKCYAYTKEHIDIIKEAVLKKLGKNIKVIENECGYTLKIEKPLKKNNK